VFGGENGDDSLYEFNIDRMLWTRVATTGYAPQIRKKSSLVKFKNTLVVFGGVDLINFQFLQDLHVLSLSNLEWSQPAMKGPIAEARGGHSSCALSDKIFVWGGNSQKAAFNELHYLDPDDSYLWFKKKGMGSVPTSRSLHSAVIVGGKWLIFGGNINDKPTNEVFTLTPTGIY